MHWNTLEWCNRAMSVFTPSWILEFIRSIKFRGEGRADEIHRFIIIKWKRPARFRSASGTSVIAINMRILQNIYSDVTLGFISFHSIKTTAERNVRGVSADVSGHTDATPARARRRRWAELVTIHNVIWNYKVSRISYLRLFLLNDCPTGLIDR